MNAPQRKQLSDALEAIKAAGSVIEQLGNEEQEKADNLPENLQQGERAEKFQAAADLLTEQAQAIADAVEAIEGEAL